MSLLPCVERELNSDLRQPDAAVIWLHGLGANGHDFEPIVPELGLPDTLAVRFIFPHAPEIPVTINGGYVMPAWYDILEMDIDRKIDQTQILASAQKIRALIEREQARGIACERIVLAGFSQGGAVAYETALSHNQRLAGLLAMSTYFATASSVQWHDANRDLPILVMHGEQDPVVPVQLGERALGALTRQGYRPQWKSYAMEHQVCYPQITDIGRWLTEVLAPVPG